MAQAIFNLDGSEVVIQCTSENLIKDICQKYVTKLGKNINSFLFLYGGNQINFGLRFKDQANSLDKATNQMRILVYRNENNNGFKCPKCGEIFSFDKTKIDEIIISVLEIL